MNKYPFDELKKFRPNNEDFLKSEYLKKGLCKKKDTFILYRILGNDLPPRHESNQTIQNLEFILKNENQLLNCEKRWILNRIYSKEMEDKIISMLESYAQSFIRIPFLMDDYEKIDWDYTSLGNEDYLWSKEFQALPGNEKSICIASIYRLKNNYVMNCNGARNYALAEGKKLAKWILPWDGNCFISSKSWTEILNSVTTKPHIKYFLVPMARLVDNRQSLYESIVPIASEEPQVLFRSDAEEKFNPEFAYGRRSKVELFWRLLVPGSWQEWKDTAWDLKRSPISADAGNFFLAGSVYRLYSGNAKFERFGKKSERLRNSARRNSIIEAINNIDKQIGTRELESSFRLNIYHKEALDCLKKSWAENKTPSKSELVKKIISKSNEYLTLSPPNVTQKTTLAPSKNIHDYWHPAPYWWPNKSTNTGMPYERRDGFRVQGTTLHEPLSFQYDRTSLQNMFDGTTTLSLGWYLSGQDDYAEQAANFVRTWFINAKTRMNPNLTFAQVKMGHNNNEGSGTGIIEFTSIYYFLDAIRIIGKSKKISPKEICKFNEWLKSYKNWLIKSPQGKNALTKNNNIGIFYDLQIAAIAIYLNDSHCAFEAFLRGYSRFKYHFTDDGIQPHEISRVNNQHYCLLNIHAWLMFISLSKSYGFSINKLQHLIETRLSKAIKLSFDYQLKDKCDLELRITIIHFASSLGISVPKHIKKQFKNAGIWQDLIPFWQINTL